MKRNKHNSCWTECIAYILKLDPDRVPFFIRHKKWIIETDNWLRKRVYI